MLFSDFVRGDVSRAAAVSRKLRRLLLLVAVLMAGCSGGGEVVAPIDGPYVVVLGVAQDGGFPQAACREDCCAGAWEDPARRRHVASLGIVDPAGPGRWLIDATPSVPKQLRMLDSFDPRRSVPAEPLDNLLDDIRRAQREVKARMKARGYFKITAKTAILAIGLAVLVAKAAG